jgi:hypothetical protein
MKRKAYVEITGTNNFKISGNYDTQEFEVDKINSVIYINLVTFYTSKSRDEKTGCFYATGAFFDDGLEVCIYNTNENPACLATVSSYKDAEKKVCVRSTVVEEE